MEALSDAFKKLKQSGRNTVDGIIQWMKDSTVISETTIKEEDARKTLEKVDPQSVDAAKFKELLNTMVGNNTQAVDEILKLLTAKESDFEQSFKKFEELQQKTVDNFINWMKETQVILESSVSKSEAREMFEDVNSKNVELSEFEKILNEIAEKNQESIKEYQSLFISQGAKFLEALRVGVNEAMSK